jgi:hypothetical protein
LSVIEAAADGDHRELLAALRDRVAAAVASPSCPPVALSALGRQLLLISNELSALDARTQDDVDEPAIPDEPFSGDAV